MSDPPQSATISKDPEGNDHSPPTTPSLPEITIPADILPAGCSRTWPAGAETPSTVCPWSTSATGATAGSPGGQTLSVTSSDSLMTSQPSGGARKSSSGVSGGAVAGVAIACLIAGAAVAGLVLFLLFRRKNRNQLQAYQQPHIPYNGGSEKAPVAVTTAVSSNVDDYLPQPVEDDAITQQLSKIRDNIKNHVRSYYHFEAINSGQINISGLNGLATATGARNSSLADSLANPSTRSEMIRLFISWIVLSRCESNVQPTLLPENLSAMAVAIPGNGGQSAAQMTLYSKWKTITGALLQEHAGKQAGSQSKAIADAIAETDAVLAPFVQGSVDGVQRRRNLEMIFSRAAKLGFLLFSQPGSYHFDFAEGRDGLTVFPALLQLVDDQSHRLNPPRVLWEKEGISAEGL